MGRYSTTRSSGSRLGPFNHFWSTFGHFCGTPLRGRTTLAVREGPAAGGEHRAILITVFGAVLGITVGRGGTIRDSRATGFWTSF